MPELPEVETTRRGLAPHLEGATITGFSIRNARLRWPIPQDMPLVGKKILGLHRRAKYLLIDCGSRHDQFHTCSPLPIPLIEPLANRLGGKAAKSLVIPQAGEGANESLREFQHDGTLILHLGMSGSLRILPCDTPPEKHDHFDLLLDNGKLMRLRDPRRFGAVLWHDQHIDTHPLLTALGPEPLDDYGPNRFDAPCLYAASRDRNVSIKQFIMDNHVVVGVGNIYACEALFSAGINPKLAAGKLGIGRCTKLVDAIRTTLHSAIQAGGSTLRDFVNATGNPGYFQQQHWVYGRAGQPCLVCGKPILQIKQGQRSTFYCGQCQK